MVMKKVSKSGNKKWNDKINNIMSNVMVVEDDPHWQMMIAKTLKRKNSSINLFFAQSTDQAMHQLSGMNNIDLIISDYSLEGATTGLDLWDTVRVQDSAPPFVLVSGKSKSAFMDELSFFREEAVPKYIEKKDFVSEIMEHLDLMFSQPPEQATQVKLIAPRIVALLALCLALGASFYSPPLSTEVENLAPEYSSYLASLRQNNVPPKIAAVFTKDVIFQMNEVAMNRDFVNSVKKATINSGFASKVNKRE
jgi:CheY-like chemotaxis protein